jgi:hypothetical protein
MKTLLNEKEDSNNKLIEKIKNEHNLEINELKNKLETNEVEFKRLNDLINEKEIIINEFKRDLNQNKSNIENNLKEMQKYYESKIETLNKEWFEKYEKCLAQNDEKIIEIKANCLRTIDKTKEEYESQLIALKNKNNDLSERNSILRLESEARKMTTPFVNPNKSVVKNKNSNVVKVVPNNRSLNNETKQKVSIQMLDTNNVQIEQTVKLIAPKRKKLIQSDDLYLQYLRDEP